jgi:hypothetical protein
MGERLAARATEVRMNLPDLNKELEWFKERLRPEDPRHGNGVADWTITAEYVPNLSIDGAPCYGAMCSPGDHNACLTPEDIEAKRAHILMFVPKNADDMKEFKVTFFHELRHILYSMIAPYAAKDRAAEENATHSIDAFIKQLTPEEVTLFGRLKSNPMARAYRAPAKETAMPDPIEEKNKKEPDKGGEKPAMQEGAPRVVDAIKADLYKAAMAGQPIDDLVKELMLAEALNGSNTAEPPAAPAPPPEMGMKPEEAYQRKVNTEAINAFVDLLEVPDDKKAFLRKQTTIAGVKDALAFLPKQSATMGFDGHPALRAKDGDDEPASMFYPSGNKNTMAACRVMARRKDGISARGIHKCSPQEQRETGQLMRFSLTEAFPMLREVAEANALRDRKAAMSSIGGDK